MKSKDDETLPRSSVRLDHVTKGRVRGPQGRRLPRKPQKSSPTPNGMDSKSDSLIDSDKETIVRDSLGRATSLSALETCTSENPKIRLEFQLGSEDDSGVTNDHLVNLACSSPKANRLSFEQAWFITLPDSHQTGKGADEDVDNTSDYSSMHGSPSTKSSKRSPSSSPTNPPARSLRQRIEKFLCSLL